MTHNQLGQTIGQTKKAGKAKTATMQCSRVASKRALAEGGKIELELRAHPIAHTGNTTVDSEYKGLVTHEWGSGSYKGEILVPEGWDVPRAQCSLFTCMTLFAQR